MTPLSSSVAPSAYSILGARSGLAQRACGLQRGEVGEDVGIELDRVALVDAEVEHRVAAEARAEHEDVRPALTRQLVVARAAAELVRAGAAEQLVATGAHQDVVAAGTVDDVVAR